MKINSTIQQKYFLLFDFGIQEMCFKKIVACYE